MLSKYACSTRALASEDAFCGVIKLAPKNCRDLERWGALKASGSATLGLHLHRAAPGEARGARAGEAARWIQRSIQPREGRREAEASRPEAGADNHAAARGPVWGSARREGCSRRRKTKSAQGVSPPRRELHRSCPTPSGARAPGCAAGACRCGGSRGTAP